MENFLRHPENYSEETLKKTLDFFRVEYPLRPTKQRLVRIYNESIRPIEEDPKRFREVLLSRSNIDSRKETIPPRISSMSNEELCDNISILTDSSRIPVTQTNRYACEREYFELLTEQDDDKLRKRRTKTTYERDDEVPLLDDYDDSDNQLVPVRRRNWKKIIAIVSLVFILVSLTIFFIASYA
eukprot:m.63761 g.63761  ORF g.63761 m.63761 type:complete len:184 (-) comp8087_c0_seq1:280-831(-)